MLGTLLVLELGVRLFGARLGADPALISARRDLVCDGVVDRFEASAHTVFRRPIRAGANAQHFFDSEWTRERTPGVPRIVCLGGSTTEGGNEAMRGGSYPYKLEAILELYTGRDFEVYNAGVSGWTTAESLAAWFSLMKDYAPDLVILHHAVNDLEPRWAPGFEDDYSHWRRPWQVEHFDFLERTLTRYSDLYAWLRSGGDMPDLGEVTTIPYARANLVDEGPPPGTEHAFVRNLMSIATDARASGARVLLATMPWRPQDEREDTRVTRHWRKGMHEHNELLRALAAEHGFLLADIELGLRARPEIRELAESYFRDLVHMDSTGNHGKALAIYNVLARQWLPELPMDGPPAPPRED